ncbi:MAG: tetraacyldisaccharide 4'-kinase, partial [Proteobacteria bacterium]|nr:tetraacyldisaccharide 4'-kinase [Pseudomonadota bacterium]
MRVNEQALTFDDVLLVPAFSEVLPREVDLAARLTREITLNIPLLSAAMDTVTESRLAIALAQEGGIGIIHKNMSPEAQAKQVRLVKKHESGVVKDPLTVSPDTTIQKVLDLTRHYKISGLPVVDGEDLVGIVTSRDMRFETRLSDPIRNIMTKKDKLVTVNEGASKEEIKGLLHKHRIEKVLVVNKNFQLRGLVTVKDIQKAHEFPNACKDSDEQLRVGAAVGVSEASQDRVEALIQDGVDVIVADDGLQHLRLQRDYEICVIDGARGLGNRQLLPAGPLRELPSRLEEVDQVLVNGLSENADPDVTTAEQNAMGFELCASDAIRLNGSLARPLERFSDATVHAVAGIGNPQRFFDLLRSYGIQVIEHSFPDHAPIVKADLEYRDDFDVFM